MGGAGRARATGPARRLAQFPASLTGRRGRRRRSAPRVYILHKTAFRHQAVQPIDGIFPGDAGAEHLRDTSTRTPGAVLLPSPRTYTLAPAAGNAHTSSSPVATGCWTNVPAVLKAGRSDPAPAVSAPRSPSARGKSASAASQPKQQSAGGSSAPAASTAVRSATASRRGARRVPAAITTAGRQPSIRKASRQGWTRAYSGSPGRSPARAGSGAAVGAPAQAGGGLRRGVHQVCVAGAGGRGRGDPVVARCQRGQEVGRRGRRHVPPAPPVSPLFRGPPHRTRSPAPTPWGCRPPASGDPDRRSRPCRRLPGRRSARGCARPS